MSGDRGEPTKAHQKQMDALRKAALAYPEAWEDHPWGDTVFKVKKKVFVFAGCDASGFGASFKLPNSASDALAEKFCAPTGYGLGKAGWVSARFEPGEEAPMEKLLAWLDESYRAVAPKTLVKTLG